MIFIRNKARRCRISALLVFKVLTVENGVMIARLSIKSMTFDVFSVARAN